jgi:hypothetical protein
MGLDELRKQFIVDDDLLKTRIEPLVAKALQHCRIDKKGLVSITNSRMSAANQLRLILAARAIAAQLDESISADVSLADLEACTGLPANQIRARVNDIIKSKFAGAPVRGTYRAVPHKIESFLDSIETSPATAR